MKVFVFGAVGLLLLHTRERLSREFVVSSRRNRADERNKRQTGRKKEKKEERKEGRKEAKIKKKCHDVGDRGEKNSGEQGRR